MSTPLSISNLIEDAVNQIPDLAFLRATDAEANIQVDDIDLGAANIAIYNNRPTTTGTSGDLSGLVQVEWPVEIHILGLADFDDDDLDADIIADPLYSIAEELYDRLVGDPLASLLTFSDSYTINLGDPVKLYDKTLTGVTLSFELYYSRGILCY